MTRKKIVFLIIFSLIILGIVMLIVTFYQTKDTVGYVNNLRVDTKELRACMGRNKQATIEYFEQKYKITYDENNFFGDSINGVRPIDYLKKISLEEIIQIKVEQALFAETGIDGLFDYKDFIKKLSDENQKRAVAEKNGEVFYGPREFKEKDYYEYLLSNNRIQLKQRLTEKIPVASEEEQRKVYEKDKEKQYKKGLVGTLQVLKFTSSTDNKAVVDIVIEQLKLNKTFSEIVTQSKLNESGLIFETVEFDGVSAKMYTEEDKFYKEILASLSVGEHQMVSNKNLQYLVFCKSKNENAYYDFEEVSGNIISACFEKDYKDYIDILADKAKVKTTIFYKMLSY